MVTKGRGHSLSVEMSTLDWRHGDVSLCHPLRDIELKEVALCVRFFGLETYVTFVRVPRDRPASHVSRGTYHVVCVCVLGFVFAPCCWPHSVWSPSYLTLTSRTDSLGGLVEDFMATLQVCVRVCARLLRV
jgi:hypothetical protein